MNTWKVILATVIIYTAGLFTGGWAIRLLQPARFEPPTPQLLREEFVRKMANEVKLNPEQRQRILKAVRESQERVKELYNLISPEMTEEMQVIRETIRSELTPEQQKLYTAFMQKFQRRKSEFERRDGLHPRQQGGKPGQDGRNPQSSGDGQRRQSPSGTP